MGLSLTIDALRVTSARGRVLLDLPSLELPAGTSLGVRGPSGAGKSTLLYALAGLAETASGRVIWGGDDLLAQTPAARDAFRARHIGMIFQDFLLLEELSALANAALPGAFLPAADRAALRERAADHLRRLGLTDVGRSVASFSGGERQRVSVARALASGGDVLLADEPTASLDRDAADRLIDDLATLCVQEGRTLIAVSHDPALLDRMDRVLTITDGRAT